MIVVNYASGPYLRGQKILDESCKGGSVSPFMFLGFSGIPPSGSPSHAQSPYEFKIHAIREALKHDNIVLWADASMKMVGDISRIDNIIRYEGYFMEEAGHYAGRWTNAHTRKYFNVTDDEMKQEAGGITMFSAGLIGLNSQSEVAMKFLDQWEASAKAGCFRGDWSDHRHDMTCGSIIASRLGMKYQRGGSHMAYIGPDYSTPEPGVVFYCQGMQ